MVAHYKIGSHVTSYWFAFVNLRNHLVLSSPAMVLISVFPFYVTLHENHPLFDAIGDCQRMF